MLGALGWNVGAFRRGFVRRLTNVCIVRKTDIPLPRHWQPHFGGDRCAASAMFIVSAHTRIVAWDFVDW